METPANGFFRLNIASNNSQHYTSYFCCCVYFVLYAYLSNRTPLFVFTIQMVAAIVGAVIIIVAAVILGDTNANRLPPADGVQRVHVLAYGLVAGMFGILTGISCICTQFYWCTLCSFNRFTKSTV